MAQLDGLPPEDEVRALLHEIAPGSTLSAMRATEGDHHNLVHVVEALSPLGTATCVVLKRYVNAKRLAMKARLEYKTLA